MPLGEIILVAITDAVFAYAVDKGGSKIEHWIRDRRSREPIKTAFKAALGEAFDQLENLNPDWVAEHFDASFFEHEGAPILAQFLLRNGHPNPSELAARWADSLNIRQPEQRAFYTYELEPIAANFLDVLAAHLKEKAELRELNDSRVFEQLADDLQAIRYSIGTGKATLGIRRDYLHWLIERNLYLDSRGVLQTQRQVQLKLDKVYISLRAYRDEIFGTADRRLSPEEQAELEATSYSFDTVNINRGYLQWGSPEGLKLAAEDREDLHEQRLASSASDWTTDKNEPEDRLELAEAVSRYDHLVILGDPGSGKTTLVRYLTLKHAQVLWNGHIEADPGLGKARFPISIRIAEYAEENIWKKKSLSQFLADSCTLHECPKNGITDLLQSELAKGNCLVLMDGLDEIVSADDRRGIVQRIEDFVRRYNLKGNCFVITSRRAGYRTSSMSTPFVHYMIQEMDTIQIEHFLQHWCQAVEDVQTPELSIQERKKAAQREVDGIMKVVQASPGVHRLAANPLLLLILALIHRTSGRLPQKRIELYRLAADTLSFTWRTTQGVPETALIKEEYLTPLLSKLAYWVHEHKSTGTLTEREVHEVLGEEWAHLNDVPWNVDKPSPKITEEIRKFLATVREHTGLLVERAPRRYGFMHLTFEEYYAARYLVARSRTRATLIRQHLHDPRWEEPILLALGFVGLEYPTEASELLETSVLADGEEVKELSFTPSQYEELLGQDFLFALRCLGDNIPVRSKLLKRLVGRLADELLHHTGPARFEQYKQMLQERLESLKGSEAASELLSLLVTALRDSNVTLRLETAQSLGQLGQASPEAVAALVSTLHDSEGDVRAQAAHSLGQLGQTSSAVVASLISALRDSDGNVRCNAAQSLAQLGQASPEVVAALLTALHDSDSSVCFNAAWSLGQLGQTSPEAVVTLLTALHDSDGKVRSNAAWSLSQLGQASPQTVVTLLTALHDSDSDVRSNAVQSLAQLGQASSEVIAALLTALHDSDSDVRGQAAQGLGQLGQVSPEVIAALLTALHDSDVRGQATQSLAQLGQTSPEAVAALLRALQDSDSDVRIKTTQSLGQLGQVSPEVVAALITALRDTNDEVRFKAAQSLGQLGQVSPEVVAALVKALQDKRGTVRYFAAWSLGQLGQASPEVIAALITVLRDTNDGVRFNAAWSLGQLGQASPEVIAALVTTLRDPEGAVRSNAAWSLARLGQTFPEVITGLLEVLRKAKDWAMRRDAATLLTRVTQGDEAILDALWHGLLDRNQNVRVACAQALAQWREQFPATIQRFEAELAQIAQNTEYDEPDDNENNSVHDYAYDALWLLVMARKTMRVRK